MNHVAPTNQTSFNLCRHLANPLRHLAIPLLARGRQFDMLLPCFAQPPFCPPSWNLKRICVNLLQLMSGVITHNSVKKNEVFILINGRVMAKYSVHGRYFVRHLGICNLICVKFLQVMSGVMPSNLKQKRCLYLKPFSWGPQTRHTQTDTHAHTHTHTHMMIASGEMQCVAFRLTMTFSRDGNIT